MMDSGAKPLWGCGAVVGEKARPVGGATAHRSGIFTAQPLHILARIESFKLILNADTIHGQAAFGSGKGVAIATVELLVRDVLLMDHGKALVFLGAVALAAYA
ncbi:hypothetical protein DESC_600090 [Desulfosarcina cetonica]|nr:hypothetical protein DESC_600090 [Desulfosarcina cetonica]